MGDAKTKTETLYKPHDQKPATQLHPDSQQCATKTFSASFVAQPVENHTYSILSWLMSDVSNVLFFNFSGASLQFPFSRNYALSILFGILKVSSETLPILHCAILSCRCFVIICKLRQVVSFLYR